MKKFWLIVSLLVVMLFSSKAMAETYLVKVGDTLSGIAKKNGVTLASLKSANPQIKNPNYIRIWQKINLPEKNVRMKAAKKVVKTKPSIIDGMIWKHVAADKYQGSVEWAISHFEIPEYVKSAVLANIRNGVFEWRNIPSGKRLEAVTFGKNKIAKNVLTSFSVANMEYASKDYGVMDYHIAKVLKCGNWVWWKESAKVSTPEPVKTAEVAPEPKIQSIFAEVEIEKTCPDNYSLSAGVGAWKGESSKGYYAYSDGKYHFTCKGQFPMLRGVGTPFIGFLADSNGGELDSINYRWNGYGAGVQAGITYQGVTEDGLAEQSELSLRVMGEHSLAKNPDVGYRKSQDSLLVGGYADYQRWLSEDYLILGYGLAMIDFGGSFDSTWSGDSLSDLTRYSIGSKLHRQWTRKWSSRIGAEFAFQPENNRLGFNANAEMRYKASNGLRFIFGPSMDFCLDSDISAEEGSRVPGISARVEFDGVIKNVYKTTEMRKVQPADKQLLNY